MMESCRSVSAFAIGKRSTAVRLCSLQQRLGSRLQHSSSTTRKLSRVVFRRHLSRWGRLERCSFSTRANSAPHVTCTAAGETRGVGTHHSTSDIISNSRGTMDATGQHGWRAVESSADARPGSTAKVYFNSETGVSTFEKPEELKTAQERHRDGMLAKGTESSDLSRTVTNFDDIDEEDKAGRKTRLFKRNETQGYIDTESLDAASLDKPIGEENRGFRLLTKMGWKLGQGLGAKGDGITVPVVLGTQVATLGLGKSAEDDRYTDEAARERKKLDSEVVETADMKAKRLEKAERQETIKEQVQEMNKEFYCETCGKQYKNVGEMSNHYSSYDHHHVKRLKEAAEAEKARRGKTFNRDKEQRKEWEEMQRRLKATQAATGGGSSAKPPPPPKLPGALQGDGSGIAPVEKRTTVKFGLGMKKPAGKGGFRRR